MYPLVNPYIPFPSSSSRESAEHSQSCFYVEYVSVNVVMCSIV